MPTATTVIQRPFVGLAPVVLLLSGVLAVVYAAAQSAVSVACREVRLFPCRTSEAG
ncbi:MAG: hypothetical protein R2851_20035 [Caldilineaceae bacterium]